MGAARDDTLTSNRHHLGRCHHRTVPQGAVPSCLIALSHASHAIEARLTPTSIWAEIAAQLQERMLEAHISRLPSRRPEMYTREHMGIRMHRLHIVLCKHTVSTSARLNTRACADGHRNDTPP